MSYIQQYLELIPSFPFVIQVALWFIFINALAIIIFMISAVLIRRNKRLSDELERKLYPKNVEFLKKVFNSDENYTDSEIHDRYVSEVEKVSKRGRLQKKIYPPLINALEDTINKDAHIVQNKNYLGVIRGLKIEEYLLKKLRFTNVRTRLRAFQTLSVLDLTAPDSTILPYTHSRNTSLRKESRSSYIAISNNDPFKFFDQADNSLNHWDSISLMQQLEIHHKHNLPNFNKWIKYSQNTSQLLFIIKAAAHFNQTSSASALMELLESENHEVRKEAITALGSMRILEAERPMMEMYRNQPQNCQDAIVGALLSINSGKALSFLELAYQDVNNLESKKLIAEAIYKYSDEGKAYIQELSYIEKGFNRLILEHIKNPLIPSRLNVSKKPLQKETGYNRDHLGLNLT